jgi:hypothetical protein
MNATASQWSAANIGDNYRDQFKDIQLFKAFPFFMNLEVSSPCSQKLITFYSELGQSDSYVYNFIVSIYILILSFHWSLASGNGVFSSWFPTKSEIHFSSRLLRKQEIVLSSVMQSRYCGFCWECTDFEPGRVAGCPESFRGWLFLSLYPDEHWGSTFKQTTFASFLKLNYPQFIISSHHKGKSPCLIN